MKRLIRHGLMFGNLVEVSAPALVARYNRALKKLTGFETKLDEFHVDISGYSPEIGDELNDEFYLNQGGCNRQFILLTTEQKTAPLLNAAFSTSRGILRRFIDENEAQLFALTARDAVGGELENSVFDITEAAAMFDIRNIDVVADTTESHVANAGVLAEKVARFKSEPEAWWDDVLIAQMIELAQKTGDVTRNPVTMGSTRFRQDDFWTRHFGGLYVFRDVKKPAVIRCDPSVNLGDIPVDRTISFDDRNEIAKFLKENDLVEPVIKARGIDGIAILRQKMDFIVVDVAAEMDEDLTGTSRRDLRNLTRRYANLMPEEFKGLAKLLRWAEGDAKWPRIHSSNPTYFYTLRATPGPNRDLVNRLLAELAPKDVRQLFICHKEAFYAAYRDWSDAKREYVVNFLVDEYQIDKAGARDALFGRERAMRDDDDDDDDDRYDNDDLVEMVGPWGSVRRGR